MDKQTFARMNLSSLMQRESSKEYFEAATKLQDICSKIPIDHDNLAEEAEVFQLPVTRDQAELLKRLIGPLLSDQMLEAPNGDGMATAYDGIYKALTQVMENHTNQPYVSIYKTYRQYGGPEEGGWWYTAWVHCGSVSYDTKEELKEALRGQFEWYASQPGNGAEPDLDRVLEIYDKFADGTLYHDEKHTKDNPIHDDFSTRNIETYDVLLEVYHHSDECTYLVFEWAPGISNTLHKPVYC